MRAAIVRLLRVAIAQLPALIAYLNGLDSPLWLMVGAIINAAAKYLRVRYKWNWLPV